MRAVISLLLCVSLCSVFVQIAGADPLFAPADVAAIAGDGRLTVGVNHSGRITTCRWPSPGYYDQIEYATHSRSEPMLGVEPWHGAAWAVQLDNQLIWMYDDRWTHTLIDQRSPAVVEVESTFNGRDFRVRQRIAVSESGDAFEARITVAGDVDVPPKAFWYANFSPSTRLIPHLPIALHGANDFAAFVHPSGNAIVHFRPRDPGARLWQEARVLEESGEDWPALPDGSYVVYGSPNNLIAVATGPEQGPASVVDQVDAGTLSNQRAAVGQTASAVALEMVPVDDGYTATVIAAFGESHAQAAQRLSESTAYLSETAPDALANENESDLAWIQRRALITLRTCTDAQTGSVVRSPANAPARATDAPRFGAWIALAFDTANEHDRAARLLSFYLDHVREHPRGDAPVGSIPAAFYTNGEEAAPDAMVDAAAAGRVLWAAYRHGATLNQEQMAAFYRDIWPGVNVVTDFLVLWREPGGTAPLYTFDYESKRDRRTTELYVASFLGVRAAGLIANAVTEVRPDWQQAAGELRDALRLHAIHPDGAVAITDPGLLHDTDIIPDWELFDWRQFIDETIRESGGRFDTQSLERLCKLVLSARDMPEPLRADVAAAVRRHLNRAAPDAAEAAFAYLIAHKLHQLETAPPTPIEQLSPDTL